MDGDRDELAAFLQSRGIDCADAQVSLVRMTGGAGPLLGPKAVLSTPSGALLKKSASEMPDSDEVELLFEPVPCAEAAPLFVALVGKRRLRRLHRKNGCDTARDDLLEMVPVFYLKSAEYDLACKHRWRNGEQPGDPGAGGSHQAGSENDASSSSSSSESDRV